MRIPAHSVVGATLDLSFLHIGQRSGDDDESNYHQWSSFIGIVTAIVGNVLISFALNIQRYAHIRIEREFNESRLPLKKRKSASVRSSRNGGYGTVQEQESIAEERLRANLSPPEESETGDDEQSNLAGAEETDPLTRSFRSSSDDSQTPGEKISQDEERKSYLKSPYWWAGIIMMTIGEAGNFIAYGFAPASIVSPLGVVALVSNCLIAPLMLKERFRKRDFLGVLVAIAGAVVVVSSARTTEEKLGPDDLWDEIRRWEFLTYLLITGILVITLMWASGKYGHRSILIDIGLVGLFGGYTALSTKGVASLLSYTLFRALTFPITYILVVVLVGSALLQIRYINRALQRFDSTQVIPTQFVLFTLSVIIGSAVLYRDFNSTAADRVGKFVGGCVLTFLGVYLITGGRHNRDEHDGDEGLDEEQTIGLIDEEANEDQVRPVLESRSHTISSQMSRKLLPPESVEAQNSPTSPRRMSHRLRTPTLSEFDPTSLAPSVAVTPETPSPFTMLRDDSSPWIDEVLNSSTPQPTPRLQPTQSTTQVETYHRYDKPSAAISDPALSRTKSAPSDPLSSRPGTSAAATPSKADPSSYLRISVASDAPPATPSRSVRNSISQLLPGPLTVSPLSSGLSAVVADSLRRGEGSGTRRRLGLRRQHNTSTGNSRATTSRDELGRRRSVAEGEVDPDPTSRPLLLSRSHSNYHKRPADDDEEDREVINTVRDADLSGKDKKNRLRSVSDTIGNLMKGKLPVRKNKGADGDVGDDGGDGD
ncbi:hypothetical protein UCRPC4_g05898 [Phaeomoniella chlamydospora]|uniref:Duf803 domain membrane protein n=1 Tax=Phaeomoniella chlamydospora TaxID=158046 RepID=A0A0G2E2G5_PHACM|nr:hypothetical protein UCRPC4_g05898 [Phaeomoniella chlamydospora]